jgi:hypothetical protein
MGHRGRLAGGLVPAALNVGENPIKMLEGETEALTSKVNALQVENGENKQTIADISSQWSILASYH